MSRKAHLVDSSRLRRTDDAVNDQTMSRYFADLLLPSKLTEGLIHAGELGFIEMVSLFAFLCHFVASFSSSLVLDLKLSDFLFS